MERFYLKLKIKRNSSLGCFSFYFEAFKTLVNDFKNNLKLKLLPSNFSQSFFHPMMPIFMEKISLDIKLEE